MKLYAKTIVIAIVICFGWFVFVDTFLHAYRELDSLWQHFIAVAGLSIIGVFLFFMKSKPEANKAIIDAMEMLIIGIVPTIASFPLLAVTDQGKFLISGFLAVVTVIWFVYFAFFRKGTTEKEKKDIQNAKRPILALFISLIIMVLASFGMIQEIHMISQHSPRITKIRMKSIFLPIYGLSITVKNTRLIIFTEPSN
ncbi:MAG: hypothetical protein HY295_06230 [Thaumarchaeota archaeon]|nr:hypothetical protein [Nitrososphaerota archaeon]